ALFSLYAEADALVAGWQCDMSTDCCRFGVTGREPYVTAVELAEVLDARKVSGGKGLSTKRSLPVVDERRCPMLSDEGRCTIYASRPLGCRTFFCAAALAKLGEKLPRKEFQRIVHAIEALSLRAFPEKHESRPLTRALGGGVLSK
ncbi:MAG: YkgJ family cysteine cluster protein, partial [Polyangiaceae bacterium]